MGVGSVEMITGITFNWKKYSAGTVGYVISRNLRNFQKLCHVLIELENTVPKKSSFSTLRTVIL